MEAERPKLGMEDLLGKDGRNSTRLRGRGPWAARPLGCSPGSESWPAVKGLSGMGGKTPHRVPGAHT